MKKWILRKKFYLFSLVIVLSLLLVVYFLFFKKVDASGSAFDTVTFIGHGVYGIDGYDYSNSLESLKLGYDNGIRIMETDFLFTSDGNVVLNHYWENEEWEDTDTFFSKKIYGKYTPISFYDLLGYMEEYNDLYIMIDTKEDEYDNGYSVLDIYEYIVDNTLMYNEELLDRFIIQIYNLDDYDEIKKIYDFENKIVSIYKMEFFNIYNIAYFCLGNDVDALVVPSWYIDQGIVTFSNIDFIKSKGIRVYVHTVNDVDIYNSLRELGVDGVYTDFLS